MDKHVFLDFSDKRRAFVTGDIHGEYDMLIDELTKQNFDHNQDVLISVGDLCDRGPDSEKLLALIDEPWFHRSLGNHDVAPRLYLNREYSRYDIEVGFGGAWFVNRSKDEVEQIAVKLEQAPVSLTITTPGGRRIGIVHADCGSDWDKQISSNYPIEVDPGLWSRERISIIHRFSKDNQPIDQTEHIVTGIDHVFHGHTPLTTPLTAGNRSWIDTGACYGGTLTVWDIDAFLTYKGK